MKKLTLALALSFVLLWGSPTGALAAQMLVPVGQVVGLELLNNTVTVAAFEEDSAARKAGLQEGDRLLSIDGRSITCTGDVRAALTRSQGSVRVTVQRAGTLENFRVEPAITPDGPKLGIYLRQGVTGIGTVTYYDPETKTFGALGHGVNDTSGQLLAMTTGSVYTARVVSVRRGTSGDPGQLMGTLTARSPIGTLQRNTAQGVFGKTDLPWNSQPLPIGTADAVKPGPAAILSTVSGDTPREYSVEIIKIYSADSRSGRNLLIRITDPDLLSATGGIVQGMGVSYNKDNQVNP